MYSYKEYETLNLAMQFSTTKCKPVTTNICALSYLCIFKNNIMCGEHKEEIRLLNLKYLHVSADFPASVNPGQCFIFLNGDCCRYTKYPRISF